MLVLGHKYKTRKGYSIVIHNEDHNYRYPFIGYVRDDKDQIVRPASYTSSGRYKIEEESDFDIVMD